MVTIFLLAACILAVTASDCELSEWSAWSPCYGTCYFGQHVRNRDVIRPSLPDNPGQPTKRCPHLYETSFCTPESCQATSELVDLPSRSGQNRSPVRVVLEKQLLRKGRLENEVVSVAPRAKVIPKESLAADSEITELPYARNERTRSHGQSTRTIEELSDQYKGQDADNSFNGEIVAEGRSLERENKTQPEASASSGGWANTVNIEIPKHLKPAKERKSMENKEKRTYYDDEEDPVARESTINDVIRELESATDFKTHLDDNHIRKVLRRNRKLMRALVEAYKLRTTTSPSVTVTTPLPDESVTGSYSTTDVAIQESTAAESTTYPSPSDSSTQEESTVTMEPSTGTELPSKSLPSYETTQTRSTIEKTDESTTIDDISPLYERDGDVGVSTDITMSNDVSTISTVEPTNTAENYDFTTTDGPEEKIPSDMMITLDDDEISTVMPSSVFIGTDEQRTSVTTPTTTSILLTTTTPVKTTTTTPPYWPKKGYVPNTRKHASEITSKLYMTQEIVQALSDDPIRRSPILRLDCMESRRCCKITRTECADGSVPKYVKRYYRPRGSDTCIPYHYPRCSQNEEMDEQPIQYEQNCQDLCFKGPEKRISPLFTLMDN